MSFYQEVIQFTPVAISSQLQSCVYSKIFTVYYIPGPLGGVWNIYISMNKRDKKCLPSWNLHSSRVRHLFRLKIYTDQVIIDKEKTYNRVRGQVTNDWRVWAGARLVIAIFK